MSNENLIKLSKLFDFLSIPLSRKLGLFFPRVLEAKLVREWYKINPNPKFGWIKFSLFPYQFKHKIGIYSYSQIIKLVVVGDQEIYEDHYIEIGNYCSIAGDITFYEHGPRL